VDFLAKGNAWNAKNEMNKENIDEFIFGIGLFCTDHEHKSDANLYEWKSGDDRIVYSLFATVLAGRDQGPILPDLIAKYDPRHRLLTLWD